MNDTLHLYYQISNEFFGTLISQHHAGPEMFEALNEIRLGAGDSHNHRSFFFIRSLVCVCVCLNFASLHLSAHVYSYIIL